MNATSLLALADHIENMDPGNFYMGFWVDTEEEDDLHPLVSIAKKGHSCGTTCCIAGEDLVRSGETELPSSMTAWFADRHEITGTWAYVLLYGHWTVKGQEERDNKLAARAIRSLVAAYTDLPGSGLAAYTWAECFKGAIC